MTWLMDDSIQPEADMSLAEMTILPSEISELHRHANCTETIHILSGSIRQRIGDDWIELGEGESCLIPRNTKHQTQNIGKIDARMILAYSEGQRVYEPLTE